MAKQFPHLTSALQDFIENQKMFFVATAMREGRINLSPKGMDSLRILDKNRAVWLNLTGSGNETAAHILENNRMTIMFCAFEVNPLILRLYGSAKIYHERDSEFHEHIHSFPEILGARQIFDLHIDLVQTSCGFGVPIMEFKEERIQLKKWTEAKTEEDLKNYWKEKNSVSLDGHETGIFGELVD